MQLPGCHDSVPSKAGTSGHIGRKLLPVELLHAQRWGVHSAVAGDPGGTQPMVHLCHNDLFHAGCHREPRGAWQWGRGPPAHTRRWGRGRG